MGYRRRRIEVSKRVGYDTTKIQFNGVTHLSFVRRDTVGFQTWKSVSVYSIELTFRGGAAIVTEYDDRQLWVQVIALLEDELTP